MAMLENKTAVSFLASKAIFKTAKKKQQALSRNRAAACLSRSGEFKAALEKVIFKK